MTIVLFTSILFIIYLFEKYVISNPPKIYRYVISFILLISYNYAFSDEYDEDIYEEECYAIKMTQETHDYLCRQRDFYKKRGDECIQQSKDSTMKIKIPEEQTFMNVVIESLICALATTDARSRLVAICLVTVKETIVKAIYSTRKSICYLSEAQHCYELSEFYDTLSKNELRLDSCSLRQLENSVFRDICDRYDH